MTTRMFQAMKIAFKVTRVGQYVAMSLAAAFIIIAIVRLGSEEHVDADKLDRALIGAGYIGSCVVGAFLALRPNWTYNKKWHGEAPVPPKEPEDAPSTPSRRRIGHHPDCEPFEGHRVEVGHKRCAGCTGLAIGAGVTSLMMLTYILAPDLLLLPDTAPYILIIGFILVALGLSATMVDIRSGIAHAMMGVVLMTGFFLVVASTLEATGDPAYGGISLVLCFLWLDTRIALSKWNHARICKACPEDCKAYSL